MFRPDRTFRIAAHRLTTSKFFAGNIRTLYESARDAIRDAGDEPGYYLPAVVGDSALGMRFANGSAVVIDTAGGQGVGQADRSDDLYLTEYSYWERAEDAFAGLSGSQPVGSPFNRLTIDFNAHGTGSDAYTKYQNAKLGPGHPSWNGFTPFFAGIDDTPDLYTKEFLDGKRRELGRRFVEVYPRNDVEMWLASDLAVYDSEHIDDAVARMRGEYFGEGCERYAHGVDTATGRIGGDFHACVTFGFRDGIWGEAFPPIHNRLAPDVFADQVFERVGKYGGSVVVERNVGGVVLARLRDLGCPGLYRHRHRDKLGQTTYEIGFPTTGGSAGTKKLMISDMQRALREEQIGFVSTGVPVTDNAVEGDKNLVREIREFEWKLSDADAEDKGKAAAPERVGAHDDLAMAAMLALQGAAETEARVW
jgi:hypothetical protein